LELVDDDELLAELEEERIRVLYSEDTPPAEWWDEFRASAEPAVEASYVRLIQAGCLPAELLGLMRDVFWSTFLLPVRRRDVMMKRDHARRTLEDLRQIAEDHNCDFMHVAVGGACVQAARERLQPCIDRLDRLLVESRRRPRLALFKALASLTDYVDGRVRGKQHADLAVLLESVTGRDQTKGAQRMAAVRVRKAKGRKVLRKLARPRPSLKGRPAARRKRATRR
jgi:hypothetical protein